MNQINYGSISVKSQQMLKVLEGLNELHPSDLIFIIGSRGAGKKMMAQHIQQTIFMDPSVRILDHYELGLTSGLFTVSTTDWETVSKTLQNINHRVLEIPDLAERRLDLQALAEFFLQVLSLMHNKPKVKLTEKALEKILQYSWPGQFYEFEEILENAFIMAENGLIEPEYLNMGPLSAAVGVPIGMKLDELERKYILQTLYFVHRTEQKLLKFLEFLSVRYEIKLTCTELRDTYE